MSLYSASEKMKSYSKHNLNNSFISFHVSFSVLFKARQDSWIANDSALLQVICGFQNNLHFLIIMFSYRGPKKRLEKSYQLKKNPNIYVEVLTSSHMFKKESYCAECKRYRLCDIML